MAGHSVLVAEPDASQRQIIEMLLLVHGCDVTMALNAREALAYLQSNNPDLIVASTELPQLSGYDISRKTRGVKRLRNVPVILLAPEGTQLDEARTEANLAGADLLLVKPLGDKNFGDRAVALIRQSLEGTATRPERRAPSRSQSPVSPKAAVLDPVAAGEAPATSDEIRKLQRALKELSEENANLRKQLTATGRATSSGAGVINDLRSRLARANELLEEYRRRYPDLEEGRSGGSLGQLFRRKS